MTYGEEGEIAPLVVPIFLSSIGDVFPSYMLCQLKGLFHSAADGKFDCV